MRYLSLFKLSFSLYALMFIVSACGGEKKKDDKKKVESDEVSPIKEFTSPAGYNLNKPLVIKLPDKLNEISGIVYYPKDNSVFAVVDEFGVLSKVFVNDGTDKAVIQQWRFEKSGDFEDLVLHDSTFYALKSKGDVVAFKFVASDSIQSSEFDIPKDSAGKSEYEIMYFDTELNKLVLVCKDCASDKKEAVSTMTFDPATKSFSPGPYKIETAPIAQQLQMQQIKLKASGAAIHPITKELYTISSVNKALLITDTRGILKRALPLDPKIFKQPEGITFTPNGDMFISNEFAEEGLPNLLFFKYKKQ
jgi:hypothetical protein